MRKGAVSRKTKETKIEVRVDLDGSGVANIATGIGFFDHMLEQLARHSLIDIAQGYVPKRTILSEYHAAGAICGSYMIRHGKYKYIYYVGYTPMLFDLEADPHERRDLALVPEYRTELAACDAALRAIVYTRASCPPSTGKTAPVMNEA